MTMDNPLTPKQMRGDQVQKLVWELYGIVVIDVNSKIHQANPTFERLFGYAPGELIGECLTKLLPEKIRDRHIQHVKNFFNAKSVTRPMTMMPNVPAVHNLGHEIRVTVALSTFYDTDSDHTQYAMGIVSEVVKGIQ